MSQTITIYNLGGLPTASLDAFNDLQEDFKISDDDKLMKLALVIMTRGFKYAFKAWKDPDGKLWIIDAHQRKKALLHLRSRGVEIPEIPYEPIYAADKREAVEEIAAYNSEFAKKNPDTLLFKKYNISDQSLGQFNLIMREDMPKMEGLGINTRELLSDRMSALDMDAEYESATEEPKHLTKPGDIWLLGSHVLMCGDACSPHQVVRLMKNDYADLIITDPPYNVDYEGATDEQLTIRNDHMGDDSFDRFLFSALRNMYEIARSGASIYVFHSDSEGLAFRRNFERAGFKLAQCCIWVKNSMVMGRQDYQWQHEPILYGWKEGAGHSWYADRKQCTVWNFDRPTRNDLHPTMKPVRLISYPMLNSSKENDIVVDLFSGSGSTLMACEQHGRRCRAMELDPVYVDATVERYVNAVGVDSVQLYRDEKLIPYTDICHGDR